MKLMSFCSVNHIQCVLSEGTKTFEIKKIEFEDQLASNGLKKSSKNMRLEFDSEVERDNWMKAIMAELEQLQLKIARDQLNRARAMTGQQRLAEAFDLTNEVFARMHAGAMAQLGINDPAAAWQEVRRRLGRLQQLRDAGRFTTKPRSHDQD